MCELSCLYSLNKLSVSSKTLRTHHKLQPFINNLVLPGFKYRGRIKWKGRKEYKRRGKQRGKKRKRREESEMKNQVSREREKKRKIHVKMEMCDMASSEGKEIRKKKEEARGRKRTGRRSSTVRAFGSTLTAAWWTWQGMNRYYPNPLVTFINDFTPVELVSRQWVQSVQQTSEKGCQRGKRTLSWSSDRIC